MSFSRWPRRPGRSRALRRAAEYAVVAATLGSLAWLVVIQHDQLGTAIACPSAGVVSTLALMTVTAGGALVSGKTLAGVFGAIWAVAAIAGVAIVMLGLRVAASQRRIERMAVAGIRVARRLRRGVPGPVPRRGRCRPPAS